MRRYDHGGDTYAGQPVALDVSANINPLGMPAGIRMALANSLESFQRYPDPACRELRKALAGLHGLSPDQVLCGNGAADLIFRLCACIRPQNALVTAPTFSEYERAILAHGGQVRFHFLKEERHFDLDDSILHAITKEVGLVFLCSPNNPTGRLIAADLLEKIAQHCESQRTILLLDECFIDFTGGISMISRLKRYPCLLILRAFTKMYAMAGLRLGYLLASDSNLLERIAGFGATWSVSGPAQTAGLAALREEGWAEKTRAMIREERAFLEAALLAMHLEVIPGSANYLLIKSEKPLHAPLLEKGVLVRDCSNYSGLDSRFIRVGIQTRQNNQRLLATLREVLDG